MLTPLLTTLLPTSIHNKNITMFVATQKQALPPLLKLGIHCLSWIALPPLHILPAPLRAHYWKLLKKINGINELCRYYESLIYLAYFNYTHAK